MNSTGTSLLAIAIHELPAMIDFLKAAFKRAHPDQPVPTSEEVLAIWDEAKRVTLAKDARIVSALDAEASAASHPDGFSG